MKISASEIQFSAQHHAVQKHIRSETLVEDFSPPGAWDPESLESSNSVSREQTQSDPFFYGSTLVGESRSHFPIDFGWANLVITVTSASPKLSDGHLPVVLEVLENEQRISLQG